MSTIKNGQGHAMAHLPSPSGRRLRELLDEIGIFYAVPVAISVAAFIVAIMAYFAGLH